MKNVAIRENHLYSKTYTKGQKYSGRCVGVFILKDLHAKRFMKENPKKQYINRVGISVGKKYGGAVERVRAKRIVREAYRAIEREGNLKKGFLVVLAIRDGCHGAKEQQIEAELRCALERLSMFNEQKTAATPERTENKG